MTKSNNPRSLDQDIYPIFWRLIHLSVHRYGSAPTGELLIVLTMILLDDAGAKPTVSDLAEITGLPKSSVSRYVSAEISNGFLAEIIDSRDRRRRMLMVTEKGHKEREWHRSHIMTIHAEGRKAIAGEGTTGNPGTDLIDSLKAATKAIELDNTKH